jgi:hypothetical protein
LEDNNIESIQLDYAVSECRSRICLKSFFFIVELFLYLETLGGFIL